MATSTANMLECLQGFGDPTRVSSVDEESARRYTDRFSADDVPELMAIARRYVDPAFLGGPDDESWFAYTNAWRALGALRARETVELLIGMMETADRQQDDWYLTDFPRTLRTVGVPAFEPALAYLDDPSKLEFPRAGAADVVAGVAQDHPELRDRAVAALVAQLERGETSVHGLMGIVVGRLLDLRAVEAAEPIERAFAAGIVDEMVAGDWHDVRAALGVEGLGLVPPRAAQRRIMVRSGGGGGDGSGFKSREKAQRKEQRKRKRKARR